MYVCCACVVERQSNQRSQGSCKMDFKRSWFSFTSFSLSMCKVPQGHAIHIQHRALSHEKKTPVLAQLPTWDNSPRDKYKAQILPTWTTIPRTSPQKDNSPPGPQPTSITTLISGPITVQWGGGNCPYGELSRYGKHFSYLLTHSGLVPSILRVGGQ